MMHIGVIDQVTRPLRGITSQMQSTMDVGRQGMANMVSGGAGLIASGLAIQSALMPTIEMDRKIGEVASLGVTDDTLKQLQKTALEFSVEYGKLATNFVDASYDIKSAMGDLSSDELSNLTKITGITAAATKADTKQMADYFGTMHSIFESSANEIGKVAWAEQLSGYTSLAVDRFKTEGPKISQAFKTLGNTATKEGVSLAEQFAVLGTLGQEMDGSVSATKYQAFITKAASAGDKLGLNFLDANKNLLDTASIINEIKDKFGDLDSLEKVEIAKAFGGKEAMSFISTVYDKTDALKASIDSFSELKGMEKSVWMASKMTDQWERFEAVSFALRAAIFGTVLPAINSVVGEMVDGMNVFVGWVDTFPILGQVIAVVAIGALGLSGVVAGLSLAMGVGKMMSSGWALTTSLLSNAFKVLRATTLLMTTSVWAFTAALSWPVLVIAGLVAAVAGVIYYWDDLKESFGDTAVFKFLADTIDWVIDKLNMIPGIDIDVSADMPTTPELESAIKVSPMVETANLEGWSSSYNKASDAGSAMFPYKQPQNKASLPPGMVANATTVNKQQAGNNRTYGDITVNTTAPFSLDYLEEASEFNAG